MADFRDRHDVLPSDWATRVTPRMVEEVDDPVLQAIVEEAASISDAPIAIVSLLLNHVQLFKAQVGLPEDLATTRATDRDVSFCQFAVRDAKMYAVEDSEQVAELPQELVKRYGIRSYLGAPVVVDGAATGTVCILDLKPRAFSEEQRRRLQLLADRASAHLQGQARGRSLERDLRATALAPVFGEVRNVLMALVNNAHLAHLALAELRPLARLGTLGADPIDAQAVLRSAAPAYEDLSELIRDLEYDADRLSRTLVAMEASTTSLARPSLAAVLNAARELSLHITRLAAFDGWPVRTPDVKLDCGAYQAINSISVALSKVSQVANSRGQHPGVAVRVTDSSVVIELTISDMTDSEQREILGHVRPWFSTEARSKLSPIGDGIELAYPLATDGS